MFTRSLVALSAASLTAAASASVVYSNNAGVGDLFTNPTSTNTNIATPGAALGATGWYYNSVRNNGAVGISTQYAQSGNGSVRFQGTQGPGGLSSKADIDYFHSGAMGRLGDLNSLGYDWYKSGGSAASQHAVIRLMVDADGNLASTNDRGYLVFERAYNANSGTVPTDTWVTEDLFGGVYGSGGANMWQVRFGVGNFDTAGNWQSISSWQSGFTPSPNGLTFDANSAIYGVSLGIGSGWASYDGAIDNVQIGFASGNAYSWNFEVVPTPGSVAVLGLGGIAALRRRRRELAA